MRTLLRPYEGTQPYIFVSYAHKNDAAVLEIIGTLQSRGFRVWYDEGIEAGSEWPESIASHLERAQLVLAFLSPAYLQSDNCRKEMHYALTKKKPVINVYLEQTELSPGMEMQIGNLFALMKYTYPSEEYFYDKLFSAELRALTKLQDITLSHCTRRELLIPLHKSSLTRVTLVDCDLRGDFFHSFDRERAITSLTLIRCELDSTSGLDGFTGLTELTLRDVSGALDWSALGSLPLQTVTTDAMQADAVRASGTTAAVTVTD